MDNTQIEQELKENSEIAEQIFSTGTNLLKAQEVEIESDDNNDNAIGELKTKLSTLEEQREGYITRIIGQMYKGVLVEGEMTLRNGEVFPFRRSRRMNLGTMKKIITENLHEVKKKIKTEDNLDLLEYLLEKVGEEQDYYYHNRNNRNNRDKGDTDEILTIPINKKFLIAKSGYGTDEDKIMALNFFRIKELEVSTDGSTQFKDDGNDDISVDGYISERIFKLNEDKIKAHCQKKIDEYNAKIKVLEQEIDEIKDKGGNLLTTALLLSEAKGNRQ